jgi:CRISPR-associated protein Cas1
MQSVIVSDFGVTLGRTSERLVVRGPRPQFELIEGGPQLLLPFDLPSSRPELRLVTSEGVQAPAAPLRPARPKPGSAPKPPEIEVPLFRVHDIVIASRGVSLSTDLIEACCERGIRIALLSPGGQPYALLTSPQLGATVQTRRQQLAAYLDQRGLAFARTLVRGKLRNQANLLKYFGKYRKAAGPGTFATLTAAVRGLLRLRADAGQVTGRDIDEARPSLMGLEGAGGRLYWHAVRALLAERVEFPGRMQRGAADPANAALNYGYGILYAQVWGAVMNAGLEPFAGFLHVDRPGKPSLVLDLVEEFRQPVVDRAVIALLTKGTLPVLHEGLLDDASRRAVAAAVLERLESEVVRRGRRQKLKSVVQTQARRAAASFRGEGPYRPFAFKW